MNIILDEINVMIIGNYVPDHLDDFDRAYYWDRITEEIKKDLKSYLGYWLITNKMNISNKMDVFPITNTSNINFSWKITSITYPIHEHVLEKLKDFDNHNWVYRNPKEYFSSMRDMCKYNLTMIKMNIDELKFSSDKPCCIIVFADYGDKNEKKMLRKIIKIKNKLGLKLFIHGVNGNSVSENLI